jgi:hypothetical protein
MVTLFRPIGVKNIQGIDKSKAINKNRTFLSFLSMQYVSGIIKLAIGYMIDMVTLLFDYIYTTNSKVCKGAGELSYGKSRALKV